MDFTLRIYARLLETLKERNYTFLPFQEFITRPVHRAIMLRHDIDRIPQNAVKMAQLEKELGIAGTYYFRAIKPIFKQHLINRVAQLGHEIGYHYEELDWVNKRHKAGTKRVWRFFGNGTSLKSLYEEGIALFEENLKKFRELYPVKTICMHGSPLSQYDNRALWEHYNYRDFGIIGEPYFDLDFNEVLYLTDTGRRWDGDKVSVRDKVKSDHRYSFHSTHDIIKAAAQLPDQIMITVHPERWNNQLLPWVQALVLQATKNQIKKFFC